MTPETILHAQVQDEETCAEDAQCKEVAAHHVPGEWALEYILSCWGGRGKRGDIYICTLVDRLSAQIALSSRGSWATKLS